MANTIQTADSPRIDEKDLLILRLLQDDARISVKEIAEKVHLSPTPVHERLKRLEQNGVIRQYVAVLDAAKLGRSLMVICYVSLRTHNKKAGASFIQGIMDMPEVVECLTISGQFDFMLKVLVADMNAYYNFHVNQLSAMENVGNVQSSFVMGVVKESFRIV
jgi:DNA-binding Lrp family transcriptional regulator